MFSLSGTLAPSFEPNSKSTIDLIFATYWIHSDTSTLLDANERSCIEEGMAKEEERLKSTNGKSIDLFSVCVIFITLLSCFIANFYGMDHDAYEHYIEDLCTNKTRLYETVLKISPDILNQVQTSILNPFKKEFGQLTVYRIRLHFKKNKCDEKTSSRCFEYVDNNDLLPYKEQIWPAYMGINGDCHANNRFSL